MLEALNITEAQAAGLDELAAIDLAMAKSYAARAQAAEDPDVANQLGRSYQRMARSYRQTLALKVRLQRELRAAETAQRPTEDVASRISHRKAELRDKIRPLIWDEFERESEADETETLDELHRLLEFRLEAWTRAPDFLHEPIEFLVERILVEIEPALEAALARRDPDEDAPRGPDAARSAAEPFESSA
jgi:hypothetical protein